MRGITFANNLMSCLCAKRAREVWAQDSGQLTKCLFTRLQASSQNGFWQLNLCRIWSSMKHFVVMCSESLFVFILQPVFGKPNLCCSHILNLNFHALFTRGQFKKNVFYKKDAVGKYMSYDTLRGSVACLGAQVFKFLWRVIFGGFSGEGEQKPKKMSLGKSAPKVPKILGSLGGGQTWFGKYPN